MIEDIKEIDQLQDRAHNWSEWDIEYINRLLNHEKDEDNDTYYAMLTAKREELLNTPILLKDLIDILKSLRIEML